MSDNEELPWEAQCVTAAGDFALRCRELYEINPYNEVPLDSLINTLMTELWDNGFSQSEIRKSFEAAVADLPRYAAGEERNGNRSKWGSRKTE